MTSWQELRFRLIADRRMNEGREPSKLAAHALLTELRTRIAIQPLPYQHGTEEGALQSL